MSYALSQVRGTEHSVVACCQPDLRLTLEQIYLAMEEKEDKSAFKAQNLITAFEDSFYKMSYTIHPAGIPGEAQGKSSNESWAGKQACKDYPDAALKQNIIMTTMDGQWDSCRFM